MTLEGPPVARRKDLVVPETLTLDPTEAWHENRRRMAVLLVGFLALSAVWGLLVGLVVGRPIWATAPGAVALAVLYVVVGARFGDGWMQHVLRARDGAPERVHNHLRGVAATAGIPAPEVLVTPGEAPNALALGLRRRWIIVTSGALGLDRLETEALLGHEAAHVRDGDGALASAYVLVGGAVELGMKAFGAPAGPLALLALPLWPVCLAVRTSTPLLFPREREHRADVCGALLTRYPPGMRRLLLTAAVEHENSPLRSSDPFWFAPRTIVPGPSVSDRAAGVAEM